MTNLTPSADEPSAELTVLAQRVRNLETVLGFLTENWSDMTEQLDELRKQLTAKRTAGLLKDISSDEKLEIYKRGFMDKRPHENDGSDFTDLDLVMWSSYILKDTPRREKLNYTEAYKRLKRIRALVLFFTEYAVENGKLDSEKAVIWARRRAKQFLEYVLTVVKIKDKPADFWQATSDWAINHFSTEVGEWQKLSKYDDVPA